MPGQKRAWGLRNIVVTRSERLLLWLQGRQQQHYGPKARIPELFHRRDLPWFAIEAGKVRMQEPRPAFFHDLLDAAARVGALEERLGYTFKNKITCIEALKITGSFHSLYYEGVVRHAAKNNRLALLGDRVLSLAVCEIWFQTEHSTKEHSDMSSATVSRAALAVTGHALRLHESILIQRGGTVSRVHIAETFEAILGAIYVDSDYNVLAVKNVIRKLGLDNHKYLKTREEFAIEERDRTAVRAAESQVGRPQLLDETSAPRSKDGPISARHELHAQTEYRGAGAFKDNERFPESVTKSLSDTDIEAVNTELLEMSSSLRKEIEKLNRIMGRRSGERAEVAKKALRESVILRRQGKRVSPLSIYQGMRAEMGKARDRARVEGLRKENEARKEASRLESEAIAIPKSKTTAEKTRVQAGGPSVAVSATTAVHAAAQNDDSKGKKRAEAAKKSAKGLDELESHILRSHEDAWTDAARETIIIKTSETELISSTNSRDVTVGEISGVTADESAGRMEGRKLLPESSQTMPEFFESEIEVVSFCSSEVSTFRKPPNSKDKRSSESAPQQMNHENPQTAISREQSNMPPKTVVRGRTKKKKGLQELEDLLDLSDHAVRVWVRKVAKLELERKLRPTIIRDIRTKIAEMKSENSSSSFRSWRQQQQHQSQSSSVGTSSTSADSTRPRESTQQDSSTVAHVASIQKVLKDNELIRPSEAPHLLMARSEVGRALLLGKTVAADLGIQPGEPGWKAALQEALVQAAAGLSDHQRAEKTSMHSKVLDASTKKATDIDQGPKSAEVADDPEVGRDTQTPNNTELTQSDEATASSVSDDTVSPTETHKHFTAGKQAPNNTPPTKADEATKVANNSGSSTSASAEHVTKIHDSTASTEDEPRFRIHRPHIKRGFPMWVFNSPPEYVPALEQTPSPIPEPTSFAIAGSASASTKNKVTSTADSEAEVRAKVLQALREYHPELSEARP